MAGVIGMTTQGRGRPRLQMTKRRQQVLGVLRDLAGSDEGKTLTMGQLVKICGLYDKSSARRILRDLQRMGRVR